MEYNKCLSEINNSSKYSDSNLWVFKASIFLQQKTWPLRDSNTQPSDLESDALPLRQGVLTPVASDIISVPPNFFAFEMLGWTYQL